jgi:hypothetical protein
LASSPILGQVRRLLLDDNRIGANQMTALLHSRHLRSLRALEMRNNRLDAKAARILARKPILAGLRKLDLTGNCCTAEGARALADSPHLTQLALVLGPIHRLVKDHAQEILAARFGRDVRPLVFDDSCYRWGD